MQNNLINEENIDDEENDDFEWPTFTIISYIDKKLIYIMYLFREKKYLYSSLCFYIGFAIFSLPLFKFFQVLHNNFTLEHLINPEEFHISNSVSLGIFFCYVSMLYLALVFIWKIMVVFLST